MAIAILALGTGLLLAYANGANDNFKGVATLFGSGTTSYRRALAWATICTAAGSMLALVLAQGLLAAFRGKGLVPPEVVADPRFALAVAAAAGATVLLATRLGFPVSTTHALIGALIGAGLLASSSGINIGKLGRGFLLPLLTSPLLAFLLALLLYPPARWMRRRLGIEQETCLCVGQRVLGVLPAGPAGVEAAMQSISLPELAVGEEVECRVHYRGDVVGISARRVLDVAHFLSGGILSFARGLNDTPKIAALLLAGQALTPSAALSAVGVVMAVGGLLSARRVAETMSKDVTTMNPGQGFTANIVAGLLVVGASRLGMPVSTTHVSCGTLFGIGTVTKQGRWQTIWQILLAWLTTLPLALALGAMAFWLLRSAAL